MQWGGLESCHLPEAAPRLDLLELVWLIPALADVAAVCERGSGRQSGLPRHRGSTLPAVCPAACLGACNMEDPPAYRRLDSPAHTGAEEAALVAEVGTPRPVTWTEVPKWLEEVVLQRLWGLLKGPGWQFVEEWQIALSDAHSPVALWCSGSMLASHARGPGFNPRAG